MSSDERSLIAHAAFRESSEKFDHLVLAAIVAICAYLVQSIPFGRIGFNVETMYLYGLFIFGSAGVCGFKRSEWTIQVYSANHSMLDAMEKRQGEKYRTARINLFKFQKRSYLYYRARNILFLSGFLCYVATKVFTQYVG